MKNAINPNGDKVVDVVSFNDFHGNLAEDTSKTGKNPGMAKLVGAVDEYKAANPDTVVVSAGDNYQGSAMSNLTHDRFAEGSSLLGQWVTNVMRKAAKVQIGITNGGRLRVPIAAGNITMGNLYEVMPFDNTLVKMNLKGSDLKRVIENGIENTNVGWVQVSGVKVYYDKSAAAGKRITAMFLEDGTPIDMNKYYSVVTNDFMASGGDQYDFTGAKDIYDTGIPIRDSLASALEALNGKHLVVKDASPLVEGVAPSNNNGGSQDGNSSQNGGNSSTTNGGSSSIGNSSGNGSSTNTSANNSSSALKPTLADFGVSASTLAKLPQTGSAVDTVLLIEIGAAAVMIGFAMFIAAKKRKKEKDAA